MLDIGIVLLFLVGLLGSILFAVSRMHPDQIDVEDE